VERLSGREIIKRLAAAKSRERQVAQRVATPATEEELEAIARAEAALRLVVQDIEGTTSIREPSRIQRYDDWVAEGPRNPLATIFGADHDDVDPSEDEGVVVACHWDGRAFALNGDQPQVEMVVDIAAQLQDDVIDEVWGAWPVCPGHVHPMVLDIVDGQAVWECPSDGHVVAPVGQLRAATQ
jgi:hypothetical protein